MSKNILKKQLELENLFQQIEALKSEVKIFKDENPELDELINKLTKERKDVISLLKEPFVFEIPQICKLECLWRDLNEWPDIKSVKFLFDKQTNNFLYNVLMPFNILFLLKKYQHPSIKTLEKTISLLDKKLITFNTKVKKTIKDHKDDSFEVLLIDIKF